MREVADGVGWYVEPPGAPTTVSTLCQFGSGAGHFRGLRRRRKLASRLTAFQMAIATD